MLQKQKTGKELLSWQLNRRNVFAQELMWLRFKILSNKAERQYHANLQFVNKQLKIVKEKSTYETSKFLKELENKL